MRSLTASATADAGKGAALTAVLSLVVGFVPLVSVLAVPLLPLPTAYVGVKWGERPALVSAAVASLLGGLFTGPVNGLLTCVLAAGLGVTLGAGLRRRWGSSRLLWVSTGVAALGHAAWIALAWWLSGLTTAQLKSLMETSLQTASGMYERAGVDQASIDAALESARAMLAVLPFLSPGILLSLGLVLAVATVGLAAAIFPRLERRLAPSLSFGSFRLHWSTPYGLVVGLVLVMLGTWLGRDGRALWLVGLNVLVLCATVFFVQGLAVTSWFANTGTRGTGTRAGWYVLAVVGQVLFLLLTWVGLIDAWVDFRKRFDRREPGTPDGISAVSGGDADEEETEWK
ncbi:MAG: DUF2232 domain-containing protein [Actinobacteria bacterium]|nr:DUF2232 domain-containing protein [Actinomycetota bacterium]